VSEEEPSGFGKLIGTAMFGAMLVEHAKGCKECSPLLLAILDHARVQAETEPGEKTDG
jgi:hypothetical protein